MSINFISRASSSQRAGRAGRTCPGHCWRLYRNEYLVSDYVDDFTPPEMVRIPLTQVILQVLSLDHIVTSPEEFLSECIDPPNRSNVKNALNKLLTLRAIAPQAPSFPLTVMGTWLSRIPADIEIGCMLLHSTWLGCVESALTIAAWLSLGKSIYWNNLTRSSSTRVVFPIDASLKSKYTYISRYSDHIQVGKCFFSNVYLSKF